MDHITKLNELIREASRRHDSWQVFRDFTAMAAISLSNAVDLTQREPREAEYMQMVRRYRPDELALFPQMLAALTFALEEDAADVLGQVFTALELGNKWKGQFFTPDCVCRMMAAMNLGDDARGLIERRGFIRAMEPAVGGGAMVIALARELLAQGINYQHHLHVTAVDIDIRAVHMAYVQLSLLHVPAVIVHGNTLAMEEYGHWYTPAHIIGGWRFKLARQEASEPAAIVPASLPTPRTAAVTAEERPGAQLSLF